MTRQNSRPRSAPTIGESGAAPLVAEQAGRDRGPWSTAKYCEKPDSRAVWRPDLNRKVLILRNARVQIPYPAEQANKSAKQGDKTDDQGIKSADHRKGPTSQIGTTVAAGRGALGCS